MKNSLKQILISLLIFLVLGETLARLLDGMLLKPPPYDTSELDDHLGWKAKGNYAYEGEMTDFAGIPYPLSLTTAPNGFRRYEGPGTDSLRAILVVGDSYTQAVEVSDEHTYFSHLARGVNRPVSAYGMAGYGTLQEYLILDQYLDSLHPEFLILQVCTNDFINNSIELERGSFSNVGLKRPYWDREQQAIVRKIPVSGWKQFMQYSRFYSFVAERWSRIQMQQEDDITSESEIARLGLDYEPFQRSVEDTEQMLRLIQNRVPDNTRLLVFPADGFQPQFDQLKGICQKLGIEWVESPFSRLHKLEGEGQVIYSHDGYHWNANGHKIMGEALAEVLKKEEEER